MEIDNRRKIIFFYNIPFGGIWEHIGIAYLTSYMRSKHWDAKIINIQTEKQNIERIVLEYKPFLLGFNAVSPNLEKMVILSSKLKNLLDNSFVIFGGVAPSAMPRLLLKKYKGIDIIVIGEGEHTLYEVSERLLLKKSLVGCRGIAYRNRGKIQVEEPRPLIEDLNSLPFPARDMLYNIYQSKYYNNTTFLSSSRGCVSNCSFCDNFMLRDQPGKNWRGINPKRVVDEIELLTKTRRFHLFHFQDRTFEDPGILGKKRIENIANEIIQRSLDITYTICTRSDSWDEDDNKLIDLLRKSGLCGVQLGIEAGTDRTLRLFNKGQKVHHIIKAVSLFNKKHIAIDPGFIMFHPYSTIDELKQNRVFLEKLGLGYMWKLFITRLEITPRTKIFKKIENDGLLITNNYQDLYNYKYIDKNVEFISNNLAENKDSYTVLKLSDEFHSLSSNFISYIHLKLWEFIKLREKIINIDKQILELQERISKVCIKYFDKLLENLSNAERCKFIIESGNKRLSKGYKTSIRIIRKLMLQLSLLARRHSIHDSLIGINSYGGKIFDNKKEDI